MDTTYYIINLSEKAIAQTFLPMIPRKPNDPKTGHPSKTEKKHFCFLIKKLAYDHTDGSETLF